MTRTGRKASGAGTPSRTHGGAESLGGHGRSASEAAAPASALASTAGALLPPPPPQRNSLRKVVGRLGSHKEWALEGACEELALEGALEAQAQQNAFRGAGTGACTGLE